MALQIELKGTILSSSLTATHAVYLGQVQAGRPFHCQQRPNSFGAIQYSLLVHRTTGVILRMQSLLPAKHLDQLKPLRRHRTEIVRGSFPLSIISMFHLLLPR